MTPNSGSSARKTGPINQVLAANCKDPGPPETGGQTPPSRVKTPRSDHKIPPIPELTLKSGHKIPPIPGYPEKIHPGKLFLPRNHIYSLPPTKFFAASLLSRGYHLSVFSAMNLMCEVCCGIWFCGSLWFPTARIPVPPSCNAPSFGSPGPIIQVRCDGPHAYNTAHRIQRQWDLRPC